MQPGSPLDTDVAVETPEHVVFRHRLAGPGRRLVAYLLDLVICYGALAAVAFVVLLAVLGAAAAAHAADQLEGVGTGILLLLLFAAQWLYFAVLEAWLGATPGKRALGCKVILRSGRPATFAATALRNVMRAVDALPLAHSAGLLSVAGLVSMVVTRHFQRLGDLVAGTIVVAVEAPRPATAILLAPPASAPELASLPGDVRLDADERLAIELYLRRRDRLGRARSNELAAMLSPVLAERLGGPPPDPARAVALLYDRAVAAQAGGRAR